MQSLHDAGNMPFWFHKRIVVTGGARFVGTNVRKLTGFRGRTMWDTGRPEGQFRRWMGVGKATEKFSFQAENRLVKVLSWTVEWLRRHGPAVAASGRR